MEDESLVEAEGLGLLVSLLYPPVGGRCHRHSRDGRTGRRDFIAPVSYIVNRKPGFEIRDTGMATLITECLY